MSFPNSKKAAKPLKSARLMLEWALLLALAIAGAAFLHASGSTERIDNQLLDTGTALTRPAPSDEVVVVAIDDCSLSQQGNWPWSRDIHAELVERLTEAGAKLVIIDVLFLEPTDPEQDAALADAIRANGKVILPHTFGPRPNTQFEQDPLLPLPQLASAARAVGHVAVETDDDGVLRRFELDYASDEKLYPHLGTVVMEQLGKPIAPDIRSSAPVVPFYDRSTFPVTQSAASVLDGSAPRSVLKDKIVLVGATAQGMGDRYSVATGDVGLMPGVDAQANLISALIQDALINPVGAIWHNLLAAAALLVLFLAFWSLAPRYVLICAVLLVVGVLALSVGLLALGQVWLPPASIMFIIMLAYPIWSWRRLSHASRYLEREAARLTGTDTVAADHGGLDYVSHQIEQLRGLVRTVHDSLSFLRRVIETAPDAIVVLDRQDKVQMLNAKADLLFPEGEEMENAKFADFLASSNAHLAKDSGELVTGDGRTFLIARAELDATEAEDTAGSIIALREVTELRRLDDERRQMLEFLSHDMRTPQVAIVGLTRSGDADPDTLRRIRLQADRTLKLADDFVQLARLDSPNLQKHDADIGALVEEACDRAYTLAESKQITLEQDVPEDPCFAAVDASLIARMLDNLIGNAIKYSYEGAKVFVGFSSVEATHMVFTVADNGPGLSQERQAEPFARFGAHSTHAGPSSGLGLALVKKVVDAHDGVIVVASTPGAGTRFTITLPIEEA